eukprot:g46356.t1
MDSLYMDDITVFFLDLLSACRLMSICNWFELASGVKALLPWNAPSVAKRNSFDHKSIRKWSAHSVLETLCEKDRVDSVRLLPEQTVKVIWQNASSPELSDKHQDVAWLV